jgi:hypothetical protein
MAQDETPTTAPAADDAIAAGDDPIGLIDDNIVRRLVRMAVHVRGYAPYYAATAAFGAMLLVVPALGGGDGGAGTFAAGVTDAGGAVAPAAPSAAPRPTAAPTALASTVDDFFTPAVTTEATRTGPTYSFDDFDYDSDDSSSSPAASEPAEKPCYIAPPGGAPVSPVSPERETKNAQDTLESAVGQEGPGEASEGVKSVVDATGQCEGAETSSATAVPTTPLAPTDATVDADAVADLVGAAFVF